LRRLWKDDGFTLVEAIAGALILAIGLLALVTACQAGRDTQRRAVYIAVAREIAQSEIEALRADQFDSILAQVGDTDRTDAALPAGNHVMVSTSLYPDASSNRIVRLSVRVTWPEANGTREVYYETLIARL
jgi:type II secretory pathway pseudopilin PulG